MLIVLSVLAVNMAATSTTTAASKVAQERSSINGLIENTWHMQRVMGLPLTPTNRSYQQEKSIPYLGWVKKHWKEAHWKTLLSYKNPPHLSEFLCIHGYEGSWTDDYSPYWGGLQMDLGFQGAYGGYLMSTKGTANRWTPLEQIWTAEKAFKTRGFWPWPNTARYCGLL